jgi:hypothetical protein
MKGNGVNTAFELLREEIDLLAKTLREEAADACKTGNYDLARRAIEDADHLSNFRERVESLQKEWDALATRRAIRERKVRRACPSRLPRGLRTPENAFRRPILEALVELGGKARASKVLDLVEEKMKTILKEVDFETLPSSPREPRWRNTCQWCRMILVQEGLMRSDSPRGIWEISELGRRELEKEG